MSQSEAFWHLLPLFEEESRITDEVLSQLKEDTAPAKALRRPPRLRHKRWTPQAQVTKEVNHCPTSEQDNGSGLLSTSTTDPPCVRNKSPRKSDTLQTSNSESSEKMKFFLSGAAFSTEDPESACVDSLYSNLDSCRAKIRLKKPQHLRKKHFRTASLSIPEDFFPSSGNESLAVQTRGAIENLDCGDVDTTVSDRRNKQARNTVPGKGIKHCYSLRSQSKESSSEVRSESSNENSVTHFKIKAVSLNTPTVSLNVRESSTLLKQVSVSKKPCCARETRKRLRSDGLENAGDTVESKVTDGSRKDGATVTRSDCRGDVPKRKRQKLSPNARVDHANSSHRHTNAASAEQQGVKASSPTASRPGHSKDQSGHTKDQSSTELASLLHQPASLTGGRIIRHRLRHHGRRIVSRNTNLLCSSCVHGFLRTECLLCASLKTVTHMIVEKAKRPNPGRPTMSAAQKWVGKSSLHDRTNHQCGERSVSSKISKQKRILHAGKLAHHQKKASVLKSAKQRSPKSEKTASVVSKGYRNISSLNNRSKLKKDSSSPKQKPSTTSGKRSSQKKWFSSAVKRQKLSRNRDKISKADAKVDASFVEDSVIDYHKSMSVDGVEDSPTFTSAKDVFAQLCRLEERSKDYDLGTLQTIMPLRGQEEGGGVKCLSNSVSVYSRKSHHVGGVWKTILS